MSIFSSALATYPPSLFFEDGEPRCCKTKSELKKDLQETVSRRSSPNPDKLIIDVCALLWTICWPTSGTVKDFAEAFLKIISSFVQIAQVFLIFDQYHDNSIKNGTRWMLGNTKYLNDICWMILWNIVHIILCTNITETCSLLCL